MGQENTFQTTSGETRHGLFTGGHLSNYSPRGASGERDAELDALLRVAVNVLLVGAWGFGEAHHGVYDPVAVDLAGGEHVPAARGYAPAVPARMITAWFAAGAGEDEVCVVEVGLPAEIQDPAEGPGPTNEGYGAAVAQSPQGLLQCLYPGR